MNSVMVAIVTVVEEGLSESVASWALELIILMMLKITRYIHPEFLPNPWRQETIMLTTKARM